MEGAIILHEIIHELHSNKQDGVIFKIDFEKVLVFLSETIKDRLLVHP